MRKNVSAALGFALLIAGVFARSQTDGPVGTLQIAFPGKAWRLEINSPGFTVQAEATKPDGRQYLLAKNDQTGIVLSITLEKDPKGADSKTCPNYLRKQLQSYSSLGLKDVQYSTIGTMDVAEYLIPKYQSIEMKQKNFVGCTAKEDIYADIHLSKVQFKEKDKALFTSILKTVRFVVSLTPQGANAKDPSSGDADSSSRYYMNEGSRYYLAHQYQEAIEPYQKALELEKHEAKLDKNLWRVLVDNLGIAYGVTGDLDKAEATFRYGLSKDPSYPMFFYNMACVYAERNDLDDTLEYLTKAFEHKADRIPGENMPDPRKDGSFTRFLNNKRFRSLVDSQADSNK